MRLKWFWGGVGAGTYHTRAEMCAAVAEPDEFNWKIITQTGGSSSANGGAVSASGNVTEEGGEPEGYIECATILVHGSPWTLRATLSAGGGGSPENWNAEGAVRGMFLNDDSDHENPILQVESEVLPACYPIEVYVWFRVVQGVIGTANGTITIDIVEVA